MASVLVVLSAYFLLPTVNGHPLERNYQVRLSSSGDSTCRDPSFGVLIATRDAPLDSLRGVPAQPFSDWKIAEFYTEECDSTNQTLIHNIQNNTVYQFRVQLSPAHSCHCVNIETVGDITLLNGRWCIKPGIIKICADESRTSTHLSEPVAVVARASNYTTQIVDCDRQFVMDNIMNGAVGSEELLSIDCPLNDSRVFEYILDTVDVSPVTALNLLLELPPNTVNNTQRLPLLTRAFTTAQSNGTANKLLLEAYIKVAQDAINEGNINFTNIRSLLTFLDDLALLHGKNTTINESSIMLVVQEVVSGDGPVLGIAVDGSNITLPAEVFTNMNGSAIVASYYFQNLSRLLSKLTYVKPISPILSSTLSCDGCRTSNLSENVNIFFTDIAANNSDELVCVYTDIRRALPTIWRDGNCNQSRSVESRSILCSCNHLTHFAIAPRSRVIEVQTARYILLTIDRVLTPPSLLLLLATIFTFIIHKSLWNMRNYIHIMLCANLFAQQLLALVGYLRTENKAVCSVIAMLLQYMLLVVFMWVLMEGVVLYVALVRVFVTHPGRYIAGFTITSYVVPLVYMAVVVPMGFLVNTDNNGNHYGVYTKNGVLERCWLSPTKRFNLTFFIPVAIIILINIGFVIMSLCVMYRHFKKQEKKTAIATARHWIKVSISLMVIMGVPYIISLLSSRSTYIAYISTVFISLKGTIIFILFVPLSKQVRQAYFKWWNNKVAQSKLLGTYLTIQQRSPPNLEKAHPPGGTNGIIMGTFNPPPQGDSTANSSSDSL